MSADHWPLIFIERKQMSRIEQAMEKAAQMRGGASALEAPRRNEAIFQNIGASREQIPGYAPPPEPVVDTSNPYLVSANNPSSRMAEEYRKLKSVIVGKTHGGEFLNTLMVTSALGSEGKSITALNLAISLAQECDHTVLLIDADLRKPSLHRYLGLEPALGLADCLIDGIDVGKAFIKTGIGRLSFLPSGRRLENPAEMLSSQKMRQLLAEMKHRYRDRYLIIDTPPVLPVAETRSLSAQVDGVVFVVREGVPSPDDVREACGSLGAGKVMGLVYNDSVFTGHSYRYSYSYGGYGQQDGDQGPVNSDQEQHQGILKRMFKRGSGEGLKG
jgi:exopolysaccharide/PEP-CTERM locus tyrosine autokinase